ncbi:transposable element Tc1 transposase [Trichonephila clavipes]|nr:transposable element Tc1 transposase [Trichonephila clavipes]
MLRYFNQSESGSDKGLKKKPSVSEADSKVPDKSDGMGLYVFSYGLGRLHIVSGTVKAMDYIETPQNKLLPTANCWEQWTRDGTHARKTGCGATRKSTRREDRRIVRQALVNPTVIRSTIQADIGVAIVPQTVSRHLAEANLKSKRPFRCSFNTGTSATASIVVPSQINVECHRLAKCCV